MQISDLLEGLLVVIIALVMLIFAATVHIWAEPKKKKDKEKKQMNMSEWAKREVEIVKEDKTGDEELCRYADGCYDSALKAYLSLCEDGHSGMSIGFTLGILNRLVKGLPLSPIEGKEDEWEVIERKDNHITYQNKRCFALFKKVINGEVSYNYVDKTVVFYNGEDTGCHNGHASKFVEELHPTTLPFMPPEKSYKVYCNEYDSAQGDYVLREYTHLINPDGEREELNRYFLLSGHNDSIELTKSEFDYQKAVLEKEMEDARRKNNANDS